MNNEVNVSEEEVEALFHHVPELVQGAGDGPEAEREACRRALADAAAVIRSRERQRLLRRIEHALTAGIVVHGEEEDQARADDAYNNAAIHKAARASYEDILHLVRVLPLDDPEQPALSEGVGSGEEGHRVEIEFDGFSPSCKLIHPATGCEPSEGETIGCWLNDWLENEGCELLRGKLTLPVTYELDGDHPIFWLPPPPPQAVQGQGAVDCECELDIVRTKLGRIRAAVEADADMEKLPALRGFLIHESAAGKEVES